MHQYTHRPSHHDVRVVGAGPDGRITALFPARDGWRVTVLERSPTASPLPRAGRRDDEVERLPAHAGLGDRPDTLSEPAESHEWRVAHGDTLLRFDRPGPGPSGRPRASMTYRPDLERAIAEAVERCPKATVLRGDGDPAVPHTHGSERSAHVLHAIGMPVEPGEVIRVTDADEAARRDAIRLADDADVVRAAPAALSGGAR
ncbi:FAD-dependent monooxygenase [Streptomyces sp. NPDC001595]|uniref:FAD-dependent monooxygenase n=1 Tax=Streptomyces sp. NPDC001532 TaxID=3154520 RepID=UPI00331D2218